MADSRKRADIYVGQKVLVVKKIDQPTGKLTQGIVMKILTNSNYHPRGIKVMLEDGIVGRVQQILEDNEISGIKMYED